MDVIRIASHSDHLAAQLVAYATKVVVQLWLHRWLDEGLAMLGAEHQMEVVFDE